MTRPEPRSVGLLFRPDYSVAFAIFTAIMAELIILNVSIAHDGIAATGRIATVFLSLVILERLALKIFPTYRPERKDLACLAAVLFGECLMIWFAKILSLGFTAYAMTNSSLRGVQPESFLFAVPFAAGGLLMQAILGFRGALMYTIASAILSIVYVPAEPLLALFVFSTSAISSLSLSRFRSRSAYLRAGLNVSLIALPFALASVIVDYSPSSADTLVRFGGALMNGILCTFVASGTIPILEHLGGYATDMRLIEMATLDHPLLKELSIQAPGTWNHSMVMGMMGEAAAESIGANPILTRVGAYFHDIGKMTKPLYFVENQTPGENRHDKLSPSMSALIIRSHVKEGIELANEHKVPQILVDMIPQHHGTARIEYFFEKARREAEERGEDPESVDPSLYCYPGPKPQSREAGVLMLADGIEAAVRTLSEPTMDRIQGLVQKMLNKAFSSGELDECQLTLHDLHHIAKCFTRVLTGIYHQRIAYAEPAEKVSDTVTESSSLAPQSTEEPVPAKVEDLKRLGM